MALAPAATLAGPATAGTTPSPGDPSEAPPGRIQGNGRGRLFPTGSSAALLVIWGFIDRNRVSRHFGVLYRVSENECSGTRYDAASRPAGRSVGQSTAKPRKPPWVNPCDKPENTPTRR